MQATAVLAASREASAKHEGALPALTGAGRSERNERGDTETGGAEVPGDMNRRAERGSG